MKCFANLLTPSRFPAAHLDPLPCEPCSNAAWYWLGSDAFKKYRWYLALVSEHGLTPFLTDALHLH
jgi:hypothetical protein